MAQNPMHQKQRDNYFTRNIQQNGEEFLASKTSQDIQRDAKQRIFKDMIFGNIDYAKYGKYFIDSRFISQLCVTAEEELTIHTTYKNALYTYDISMPGNIRTRDLLMKECSVEATLSLLFSTLQMVRDSSDIGYLPSISQSISGQSKKCFSEFY